ncbi:MAG: hypothetical protein ABIJ27_07370 [Candidatus Omnitrophota bacterium]
MCKVNRFITLPILAVFFFNTAVSNMALAGPFRYGPTADTLAAASKFSKLAGIESQDFERIEGILRLLLASSIDRSTHRMDISALIKNAADLEEIQPHDQFFFREMRSLPAASADRTCRVVMCRTTKEKSRYGMRTYYALFSDRLGEDGGLAMEVYTRSEWNYFKKNVDLTKPFSQRQSVGTAPLTPGTLYRKRRAKAASYTGVAPEYATRASPAASTPFIERTKAKEHILTLMPFTEKVLSRDLLQPDFSALSQWLAENIPYQVDLLNFALLENGLIVVPVMIDDEWRYLMVRIRGDNPSGRSLAQVLDSDVNWIENEAICGVASAADGVEAFIVTREGMEAIIWSGAREREYHAVWTDWDETVTFEREDPKPEVLRRLLNDHKRGVRCAVGSRRRVSFLPKLVEYFKSVGATDDDLKGFLVYLEDGAVLYDLGDIEHPIYVHALYPTTKQQIVQYLQTHLEHIKDAADGEPMIQADAGESRVRVYIKDGVDIPAYLEELNRDLRTKVDRMGQMLEARFDAGSTDPRIMIGPAGVEKAIGVRDYSERTGIPVSRIAKFDDQGQSGQEDVTGDQNPILMRGNGWSAVRVEGGFSVNRSDRCAVFPVRADKKYDAGFLELLETLNITPAPEYVSIPEFARRDPFMGVVTFSQEIEKGVDPESNRKRKEKAKSFLNKKLSLAVSKPIGVFRSMMESVRQHFIKIGYDTYEEGFQKIRERVIRLWWTKRPTGKGILCAVHGGAGSGKSTMALLILRALERMLGVLGKVKGIDDWLFQSQLRPDPKTKYMPGYEESMRELSDGKTVFTPMYDDEVKGNLLFGRGDRDNEIVLYNGKRALIITYDGSEHYSWRDIEVDPNTGQFKKEVKAAQFQGGLTRYLFGITPIELELIDGCLRIAVRGNDHWADGALSLRLPDGRTEDLSALETREDLVKAGLWEAVKKGQAVWAQDVLRPGLNIIEGTRVLNNEAIAGEAADGEFTRQGLFDETVELGGTAFETRRVRAIRRTQARGLGLDMIEREMDVFTKKQTGSERQNIPTGRRARVHIAVEFIPESIWQKYQSGELSADSRLVAALRKDIGIMAQGLVEHNDRSSDRRIKEIIFDHVAKAGVVTYPGDPSRFAAPSSQYDTFSAGILEIKVSRGRNCLDDTLVENYRKLKERGRRVLDPGQIVDLSDAGPLPVDRGNGVEYVVFGKVLVQNHIPWMHQVWEELLEKSGNDEHKAAERFRIFIDKFFNLQQLMWRRGITDTRPDLMWRYGKAFIEGKWTGPDEEVVATTTSSMHAGDDAIAYFDPEAYLSQEIMERIPEVLRPYYMEQVSRRVFDVLHYHPASDNPADKAEALATARETLRRNFFENDLPEPIRTVDDKVFPAEGADHENPIRNISVSHPFIDWDQINYLMQWVLVSNIRRLRAHFFPLAERTAPPRLVWTKLVLDSQENVNTGFYRLLSAFYELLLDNPRLLDGGPEGRRSNHEICNLVREAYERPFRETDRQAPFLGRRPWTIFAFFLDEARRLEDEWSGDVGYQPEYLVMTDSPGESRRSRRESARQKVSQAIDEGDDDLYGIRRGSFDAPAALLLDVDGAAPAESFSLLASEYCAVYNAGSLPDELKSSNFAVTIMKIARKHKGSSRHILLVSSNPEHIKLATIAEVSVLGVVPQGADAASRKAAASELIDAGSDFIATGFSQTSKILDAVALKRLAASSSGAPKPRIRESPSSWVAATEVFNKIAGEKAERNEKPVDIASTIRRVKAVVEKIWNREIPTDRDGRYMLLLPFGFYAEGEFSRYKDSFGDRFDLCRVGGRSIEQFIDTVIDTTKRSGREGRAVALVPYDDNAVAADRFEAELARLKDAGVRFVTVNMRTLLNAKAFDAAERMEFELRTYLILLLVRRVSSEDIDTSSFVYQALNFYLDSHFELDGISATNYMHAIVNDSVANLIRGVLLYRPAAVYDIPDYDTIVAPLRSA